MDQKQKTAKTIYFFLFFFILILIGEFAYLEKNKKRIVSEEVATISPSLAPSGYITIEKSNPEDFYFHEINPERLPYYGEFKQFYDSFYLSGEKYLLNKEVNNNFFVNGQGYYYYYGIPVKLFGIYEGYYFENDQHYVLIGVLSKDNQYRYFRVNLLSPQKTVIKIWDFSENQTIHDIFLKESKEEKKYTLDKELIQSKLLKKGIPVSVFIETGMPNTTTVIVVFVADRLNDEKFNDLSFN